MLCVAQDELINNLTHYTRPILPDLRVGSRDGRKPGRVKRTGHYDQDHFFFLH